MNPIESRSEYRHGTLLENDVLATPTAQLQIWLEQAASAGLHEPHGMTVVAVDADGQPSSRVVLLRGLDSEGLRFFSNYQSRKGLAFAHNPKACASFWWPSLERQVRVEGVIAQTSAAVSDAYFAARPYESQLASAASPQSQPTTRAELERRIETLRTQFPESVPRPAHWGGYTLQPQRFEFWQGRPARTHDRIVYTLDAGLWSISRVAP